MMRVLGIDAGRHTGLAVLDVDVRRGTAAYCDHATLEDWPGGLRLDDLRRWLGAYRPELVAVEVPEGHTYTGRHPATAHLIEAAGIGHELAGLAYGLGYDISKTSATVVRRALCRRGNASNGDVERMLRLRVSDWPRRSNNHARDAAAVALYAALRAPDLRAKAMAAAPASGRRPAT